MAQYQYIGIGHTRTILVQGGEDMKVVNGEIVESELPPEFFLSNGFQEIKEVEEKHKAKKK